MGDADEARKAKSLNNIEHHLKELVRVMSTLNENFVALVKVLKEADVEIYSTVSSDQLTLEEADKENGNGHSNE